MLAVVRGDRLLLEPIGDSRAYRMRGQAQLTRDHSLLQEQIDAGLLTPEQAQFSRQQELGDPSAGCGRHTVLLETHLHDLLPGDLMLMCSDGLSDMVPDAQLAKILLGREQAPLEDLAQSLISAANDAGDGIILRSYSFGRRAPQTLTGLVAVPSSALMAARVADDAPGTTPESQRQAWRNWSYHSMAW